MPTQDNNSIRLVGRVSQPPEERELPSGDRVCTFRVIVPRTVRSGERQTVDALECAAWTARARRTAATWSPDDVVEVNGALRRRFFQSGAGRVSRVEVEVSSVRTVRRAATA